MPKRTLAHFLLMQNPCQLDTGPIQTASTLLYVQSGRPGANDSHSQPLEVPKCDSLSFGIGSWLVQVARRGAPGGKCKFYIIFAGRASANSIIFLPVSPTRSLRDQIRGNQAISRQNSTHNKKFKLKSSRPRRFYLRGKCKI